MRKPFKMTKKTQEDLYGAFDIYDAEVASGEYKADLWDIDESNTLLVDGAEGAAMFLTCAHGELDTCNETMGDFYDRNDYARAYRAHARITKIMDQVLEVYKDELVNEFYGVWKVKN
jgi:hypothetical protein